ncbi:hypothetical protein [Leptospira borgpetersenii]|uniref:hypothetical protein n=1 Tax=Leptospira borgpetersenii TaxID=174 RepID=UPI001E35A942|nr:hypothetical protein [Leptospira borgpetersenii]
MLFSNELNYWVIKKNAKKYLLLRMGRHIGARLQNMPQNIRIKNIRVVEKLILYPSAALKWTFKAILLI